MESDDLDNLEEELYSKIYHDSNSPSIQAADFIITSNERRSTGTARYYQDNNNKNNGKQKQTPRFIKPRKFQHPPKSSEKAENVNPLPQEIVAAPKVFVPYSSVLFSSVLINGDPNVGSESIKDIVIASDSQPSNKTTISKDEKVFTSPSKKIMKLSAKAKGKKERQPNAMPELIEILSSDDDNSVIYVANPAPPLIAVESSSDDDGVKKVKRIDKKGGGSPSTSSVISDEFIVRSDKSRLKNIFHKKDTPAITPQKSNGQQMMFDEDTSNDSIYNTKLMAMNGRIQGNLNPVRLSSKLRQRGSSDEEDAAIFDMQRDDSKAQLKAKDKRTRYDKPNYNECEFSSLITNAIVPKMNNEKSQKKTNRRKSSSKSEVGDENACDLILNVSSQSSNETTTNNELFAIDLSTNQPKAEESGDVEDGLDCEIGWNDEMKYFYNEYSYGRDFSITNVRSFMSCDNWKINNVDRTVVFDRYAKKIRCRNCNEVGHKAFQCYRPKKKIICFMCGEVGHFETRCPRSLCLRCGKESVRFTTMCDKCAKFSKKRCPLCKNPFHDLDQCPDKWRRYHSTTSESNDILDIECKRNERVYCSVCAKQGHFADNCTYFNKQKDAYITSGWFAISNKPSYSSNCKFEINIQNEQVLQLLSYMDTYFFNLKLPANCQFYPKFRQRYLEEKCSVTPAMIEYKKEEDTEIIEEQQKENIEVKDESFKTPVNKPTTCNDISEAKILVSNFHHTRILRSQRTEVESLGDKFNVAIKFPENTDQKHLFVLGTIANQSLFQKELREFFFKCELLRHQEMIESSTQLPKTIGKVVDRVKNDLKTIKFIGVREVKRTLDSFLKSERELDFKNLVRLRRSLNILFIGYAELKDGIVHLREMKKILDSLEKQIGQGKANDHLDQDVKNKLASHLKYIFSPFDHGNYLQLFRSYKQVVMNKKSKH